ncbi:MAG: hypothetical protein IT566_07275 [Rhodospirillaceae bacterium]|nr:hypothetical protein [Rhodospirillaceae bacterium]
MAKRRRDAMRARTPERQIEDHFAELPNSPTGLAGELAAAMLAKKSLDTTRQVNVPFPEDYFTGVKVIDAEALETLHVYERKLQIFREQLVHRNTIFTISVARGVSVWITSIHALRHPELRPKGDDLWARLIRGEPELEGAYFMMLRRDITDVEREYMKFRPAVFLGTSPAP